MLEIVNDITMGKGTQEKFELLQETAETVAVGSLCALGKTAPNPVFSTIKYFASEYEAHINEKVCPAGVCRELIHYSIDMDYCKSCNACFKACPHDSVIKDGKNYSIDDDKCHKCGICGEVCKFDAVNVS
jgi:heterodisulfide reductase subunit A-like polyferredoxin